MIGHKEKATIGKAMRKFAHVNGVKLEQVTKDIIDNTTLGIQGWAEMTITADSDSPTTGGMF